MPRKLDPIPLTLLALALVGGIVAGLLGTERTIWPVLILVVMLALIGGTMLAQRLRRRRADLGEWAGRNGWRAAALPDGLWRGSPPFTEPTGRASEILGRPYRGVPATSFTWSWNGDRRPGTRTTPVHERHVLTLDLPAEGPTVQLTPRVLVEGLDLLPERPTGDPEFDAAWHIGAHGPVVIDDRLRSRLRRDDVGVQVLRVQGTTALSWTTGPTDVERILPRVALLWAVAEQVAAR